MSDRPAANILVVDDLPEKLLVYRTILNDPGQNLIEARSGKEALAHVLRHDFAVILLDVNMPGIDGFETAALIRQRKRSQHTPIIFITAFADDVRIAQGYALGAVDCILAPVVPEILRIKVRVFVDLYLMTQQVKGQAEERIAFVEERSKREAAEESIRNLTYLAEAGSVLGLSLDYDATVRDVVRLPVPFLADYSTLVFTDSARPRRQALAVARGPGNKVVNTDPAGMPAELATMIERVARNPADDGSGASSKWLSMSSPNTLALPLDARGRMIAVLGLARDTNRPPFTVHDLTTAQALSSRAAVALDNARLYQDVELADRQKNEFISMLAHELRNPLAPIRNCIELINLRPNDHVVVTEGHRVIGRQVAHLSRLVDDLLDVSRISGGKIRLKKEPTDLTAVVALAVEASRSDIDSRGHTLKLHMDSKPLHVYGDATRLAQVLTNLLNNAAKYTPDGGLIELSARSDKDWIVISVRDNGIGIACDLLPMIFDLFVQADRSLDRSVGGLGIGLTLVQRLVEKHGGSVQALSDGPGQGSEFVIRLPADPGTQPVATAPAAAFQMPLANPRRVLVVDDNPDGAESLAMLMRLTGCDVNLAYDGPAALDAVKDYRPDLVLLDIGLPGMDGFEVARQLRQMPRAGKLTLVAVTGYGSDDDFRRSREAGFDHHLLKPVDFDCLRQILNGVA